MARQTGAAVGLTRRALLGAIAAGLAGPALADAPLRSIRPLARPGAVAGETGTLIAAPEAAHVTAVAVADLIAEAKLGGQVAFVVVDAKTGLVLEAREADTPMPPASTAKSITSLYALEHLGAGYRFETRLLATGPVLGGRITGDLILAGGGDPTLTTDDLGDMAAALKAKGVTAVAGRFLVWGGALPFVAAIDPGQPEYFGYNPSVSGMNLNFNRVNFEWKRGGDGYALGMDARGERFVPPVTSCAVEIAERDVPIFTYDGQGARERWTVARAALGKAGSRWLPVRRPEAYAGDVFRTLAGAQGIALPEAEVVQGGPPDGATRLVGHASDELTSVLREMLKYSTNMTAEAVGMAASERLGIRDHKASGEAMTAWLKARVPGSHARFVDHSGLGPQARISAGDMASALRLLGPKVGLRGLMKPMRVKPELPKGVKVAKGKNAVPDILVDAKTGTLNFVSSLVGYMTGQDGTEMVFAIFTADTARRDALSAGERERPAGGEAWVSRSKRLQQRLIARWAAVYGA